MPTQTDMVTAEYRVSDIGVARSFYGKLFGRAPDFEASLSFIEWEVVPGYWLQLRETDDVATAGPVRIRVNDIDAERLRLIDALDVDIDDVTRIKGVVAFCTFHDPFGNPLGMLQDLAP